MSNFVGNFIARLDGPLHFRFYMQPLMAILLSIHDGWQDALKGRPFYAWTVVRTRCSDVSCSWMDGSESRGYSSSR